MDEPLRVLEPGRGRTRTGFDGSRRRPCGADPPGRDALSRVFRGRCRPTAIRSDRGRSLAACWAHARRGLKEMFDSPIAKAGLERHAIEEKIRGEPPATRQAIRWTIGAARELRRLARRATARPPRSRLGAYIASGARLPCMTAASRSTRTSRESHSPVKLTAKNALFDDEGAAAWGRIASLIGTMQDEWRRALRLAHEHAGEDRRRPPAMRIRTLPWNFEPASS